jgi:ABC-type spermidine/putrescine transport system permease subunit I
VYPLAGILVRSLNANGSFSPALDLKNYGTLLQDPAFRSIFLTTFEVAIGSTVVCFAVGYPVAYLLSKISRRHAAWLLLLIVAPFWTSILVRLYAWTVILGQYGVINRLLLQLGIIHQPLTLLYTTGADIIGMTHYLLPYMVLILYGTMIDIDRDLVTAAKSLGASSSYAFARIFFPLSLRGVYAGCLLVFIIGLGFFITPAVLGGPQDTTLAIYIQAQVNNLDWGVASAMGVVLLTVTIVLFVILARIFPIERLVGARGRGS